MKRQLPFSLNTIIKRAASLIPLIILFINLFASTPINAEGENFKINHADNLEILENSVVLTGNVSVSSLGEDTFTLLTDKLVSFKDASGQYGDIECFGISKINSAKFNLKANKLFFRKDKATQKYTVVDASGSVLIEATDGTQKVEAPKVKIDLPTKKLFATQTVRSEQLIEENAKDQTNSAERKKVIIVSDEQDINLEQTPTESEKKSPANAKKTSLKNNKTKTSPKIAEEQLQKQLIARHNVTTILEGSNSSSGVKITSELTEIFTLNGKGKKAVFTDNALLKADDGSTASGEIINYYLNQKLLEVEAGPTFPYAHLNKPDGTEIIGNKIKYNSETKDLFVESKPLELSLLKIPYKENNGSISQMVIKADTIENNETSPTESVLKARQNSDEGLVELTYGLKRGWGRQLFIIQNKAVPDKKADYLLLVDQARILDPEKNQDLMSSVIKIGLGEKNLQSGFTSRARGYLPLSKSEKSTAKPKAKVKSK